jgi:hypothetical protein
VSEPSFATGRLRGSVLLAWMLPIVAAFVPFAVGLSPVRLLRDLASGALGGEGGDLILGRSTQWMLLALAAGACSPLVVVPWRLAFAWRSPHPRGGKAIGTSLAITLAALHAVAIVLMIVGVLGRDATMLPVLGGELVGLSCGAILLLPRWRALDAEMRLLGALDALFVASALAGCAAFADARTIGWWLLAASAIAGACELAMLPRLAD